MSGALPLGMKGKPKWMVLREQMPDVTCSTITVVEDWFEENYGSFAPPEILEALTQLRRANRDLREVATQAIRELQELE